MNTDHLKVEYKSTQLISVLTENLAGKMNLARIKFFGLFLCALCKVQTICFEKLATAFETDAKSASSLRRIQRFMANYLLDTDLIAHIIFKMLPHQPPYKLTMDRTNWKFGETNINVLTLAIVYQGVAFPILMLMLDKRGNSDTDERIRMINRYIRLFGRETIDCLLADREFVGEHWITYLNDLQIRYHIRIRENFIIHDPRTGRELKAFVMFAGLKCGECKILYRIFRVNGQLCYLSASKIKGKNGKPELQIIISFNKPEDAQEYYKERWQIETAFKGLKSSGFNIEQTHLTDLNRIQKLFTIVMLAFAWAYVVGVFVNDNIKPIRILKHGRRAKSLPKYGLECIAEILLNTLTKINIDIFKFLSCT
ncbi:MAG: IS4 family transposase [Tannerella sp.]|jgi:hypothetical protein|nr:IS4 family transposase [Tannerella sp.]